MEILLKGPFRKIREINQRYKHPRIHQSPAVKAALLILRIYLLLSVALLVYTFAKTMRGG
jgi:hypothetical protein